MKFDGYYDRGRFYNFFETWEASGVVWRGRGNIRKTACFYGENCNFYIDSSDGVNEDLGIDELQGRIEQVVKDAKGKPFIMFKTSYSKVHTKPLKEYAQKHGGDILPYFIWSYYKMFKEDVFKNRIAYINKKRKRKKKYDIGFLCDLAPYQYPSGKNFYTINSRREIYDKLKASKFVVMQGSNLPFEEYLELSLDCKVIVNGPGVGEYSGRMLEAFALNQALVIRKNTYDNAISYRPYCTEIDFNADDWEKKMHKVVDNYQYWEGKSADYWNKVYQTPSVMFSYIRDKIKPII